MTTSIDLDAYFDRIQWGGVSSPNFETLAGLLRAHVSRIPFENFDVLLRRGVQLDINRVQDKLVRHVEVATVLNMRRCSPRCWRNLVFNRSATLRA